ncbi:hypothetical protein EST38_g10449 [Candolleomyces aberdarensis]|uniref:Cytochrome P450 n=1 Tax=Candolleomyces aberdarensis TaxID=2316362 RepID=A0A4Q2D7C7_9AGAR|nr:hypothetical protein EST38_g10449 [Candolleomyces aberdarensis]
MDGYVQWFKETTQKELKEQTFRVGKTNYVDVWQLVKTVHTYWAADQLCGIPLKTKESPRGKYTFTASFLGLGDTERFWELLQKARKASDVIQGATRESVIRVGPGLDDPKGKSDPYRVDGLAKSKTTIALLRTSAGGNSSPVSQLVKRPVNELVANIVGLANGSSVNQAHTALNVIDFYLEDSRKENLKDILKLIAKNDADSNKRLRGYIREAMRLNPQFTGLWRVATVETEVPGVGKVKPGERIWGGFKKAHLNVIPCELSFPAHLVVPPQLMDFPSPTTVDPTCDPSKYQLNGGGFRLCIGVDFAIDVIAEILKIILPLKGLRRGPGDSGRLVKTTKIFNLVERWLLILWSVDKLLTRGFHQTNQYVKPDGSLSDWPQSMKIAWDDSTARYIFL